MTKPNHKIIVGLWFMAFILAFVSPITAGIFKQPEIAIFTLILGIFLTLVMVLELKQDRIIKGLFIISFGVIFQTAYLRIIYVFVPLDTIPEHYRDYLEIYSQVLLFACSGAGGSIIAVHADKSSLDNESTSPSEKNNCNTIELKNLTTNIEKLEKKLNNMTIAVGSSAFMFFILAIAVLIR
ncbi:hypothetical protein [Pseudomonas sp. DWP1b1]|uniref:hypothetical protein n=1 Tax=unclassified Pseudomonas TaxID=196821 RepID=UPI003CED47BD